MRWGWIAADTVALAVFVLLGSHSHSTPDAHGLQRSLLPFLLGWFLVALPLGVYRSQPPPWALPAAWGLGVTLGILIRGVWTGRGLFGAFSPVFWWISLAGVALFTGVPRFVTRWLRVRRASALTQ